LSGWNIANILRQFVFSRGPKYNFSYRYHILSNRVIFLAYSYRFVGKAQPVGMLYVVLSYVTFGFYVIFEG